MHHWPRHNNAGGLFLDSGAVCPSVAGGDEKVIAARLNTNTLEVAWLGAYRTDTDWLDYQGTPYEFQILKPVVMELAAQTGDRLG